MTQQQKKYLIENSLIGSASPESIEKYLTDGALCERSFEAGEIILSSESADRYVGILLSGAAAVTPSADPSGAVLKVMGKGDSFGIANLYSEAAFPSIITAKKQSRVLFIKGDAFKALIENDPDALREYLTLLSNKIVYLNKKIATFTAGSTEKKLCIFLAENQCGGELPSSISMSALADMLSVGRASLYRALDTLSEQGLIARDGKSILIPDKNALLQFCK